MPKVRSERPTLVLVAPWWNHTPDPATSPCDVLERIDPPVDEDAEETPDPEWRLRHLLHAPRERMVLYREVLHEDTQRLVESLNFFGRTQRPGRPQQPMSKKDLARSMTLSYTIRVTEMTDEDGVAQPIDEAAFKGLPERDTTYLQAALSVLDDHVVPILEEDYEEAAADIAKQESHLARGFPIAEDERYPDLDTHAAEVAAEHTFPDHESAGAERGGEEFSANGLRLVDRDRV